MAQHLSQSIATPSSSATYSVTQTDGLTAGGNIVPTTIVVPVTIFVTDVSKTVFIADSAYQVTAVRAVWGVAGGLAAALNVEKCTGTTAPGSGTALLTSDVDLTSTANTVASPTLTSTTSNLQLAAGNRLTVKLGGTLTGLVGCQVTIFLKRI